MRRGRCVRLIAALLLLVLGVGAPLFVFGDVIFQVPEVLVRHAAAPRPVGTGGPSVNASRNDSAPRSQHPEQLQYEYYVEHSISTADAKKVARTLKLSDFEPNPMQTASCGTCTKSELEYCETKLIADHCCCERRFSSDAFPWLPHTCYLGPKACRPLAGNCQEYRLLRICCCQPRLAEHWKCIMSKSARMSTSGIALLLLSAVFFTIYL